MECSGKRRTWIGLVAKAGRRKSWKHTHALKNQVFEVEGKTNLAIAVEKGCMEFSQMPIKIFGSKEKLRFWATNNSTRLETLERVLSQSQAPGTRLTGRGTGSRYLPWTPASSGQEDGLWACMAWCSFCRLQAISLPSSRRRPARLQSASSSARAQRLFPQHLPR